MTKVRRVRERAGGLHTLSSVDAHLKLLADVSLRVSEAEEAAGEGNFIVARDAVDAASAGLAELRERWADMSGAERKVVGAAAGPVRARLDAVAERIPKVSDLSVGEEVVDPEQEEEPSAEG